MYSTLTNTATYTKIDIRKTFEGFTADLRMIARRTEKMGVSMVDNVIHDVLKLAEEEYLHSADIALTDSAGKVLKASKYTVNTAGTAMSAERAGGNNWPNTPDTDLTVILSYTQKWKNLTEEQRSKFGNTFKVSWGPSSIDNTFPHLTKSDAQLYASNGYELKKLNYG